MIGKVIVLLMLLLALASSQTYSSTKELQAQDEQHRRCQLTKLGNHYEVDKFNPFQNYQSLYCELFFHKRAQKLRMLEIGFGCGHHVHGASAKLWNKFFTNLDYYAMDYMNNENKQVVTKCVEKFQKDHPGQLKQMWLGDQADKVFLQRVVAESQPFDIIIDDGGHMYDQIIASFEVLWAHVAPGGYYIVEDMNVSGNAAPAIANWAKALGTGADTGRSGADFFKNVPKDALIVGCAFKICYLRKAHKAHHEALPKIWGEKYED